MLCSEDCILTDWLCEGICCCAIRAGRERVELSGLVRISKDPPGFTGNEGSFCEVGERAT